MANLDFFAADSDQKAVLEFLYSSTDVRVFESYSEFGQELREFCSFDELSSAFPVGEDEHGNGTAVLLQLWSPSVMSKLEIERIQLRPEKCDGHTFRYRIDGGALIQLYLGGVHQRIVTKSHYGHNSQKRARAWGVDTGVNWDELKTLSNRVLYHIRRRLAVTKVRSCPVLGAAFDLAKSGYALKIAAQTSWQYELD